MGRVIRRGDSIEPLTDLGSFENYDALVAAYPTYPIVGAKAYVLNSQGTWWAPGPILGTFYSKGTYAWNGSFWDSAVNEIAEQLEKMLSGRIRVTQDNFATVFASPDSTKEYFLDGIIDVGSFEITVPSTGLNIGGYNFDNSGLISTASGHTMFKGTDAGYIRCERIFLNSSGVGSKLLNLDNNENGNSIEFVNCNIGQFGYPDTVSFGDITDYRLFRLDNCAVINLLDGLTFNGNMSGGVVVNDTIALSLGDMSLLKEGTSLVISGDCRSNMNFNSVGINAIYSNFQESNIVNDGSFILDGFRTTATDSIPNIDSKSVKASFRQCQGVLDTYPGATMTVITEATTIIPSSDTPVKMAGTTSIEEQSSFSMPINNRLTYISDLGRSFELVGIGNFSGGNNDTMNMIVKLFDSSDTLIKDIDVQPATLNGGGGQDRAENIALTGFTGQMNNGDYLEIWVENTADSSNINTELNTKLVLTER